MEKKFWNKQGNRRLSVHSMLAPVPVEVKPEEDDGVCRLTLNPSPLRDFSMMYPRLGFARRGVRNTSRQAFTKYYESDVLRPMRSKGRYDLGTTSVAKIHRTRSLETARFFQESMMTGGMASLFGTGG